MLILLPSIVWSLREAGQTYIAKNNPVADVIVPSQACSSVGSMECQKDVIQTGSVKVILASRQMKAAMNSALAAVTDNDNEAVRIGPLRQNIANIQAALNGQPAGGYPSVAANLDVASAVIEAVSQKLAEMTAEMEELIPSLTEASAENAATMQELVQLIAENFRASVDAFMKEQTAIQKDDLNTTYTAYTNLIAAEEFVLNEALAEVDRRLDVDAEGVAQFKNATSSMVADLKLIYKTLASTLKAFPKTAQTAIKSQVGESLEQAKRRFNDSLTAELIGLTAASQTAASKVSEAETAVAERVVLSNTALLALSNSVSAELSLNVTSLRAAVHSALTAIAASAAEAGGNVSDTTASLAMSQNSSHARQRQAVEELAAAVDKYVDLVNANRIRADAGTTLIFLKVNEMLKTVQDAAANQSAAFADSVGSELGQQADGIGQANEAFSASIADAASASASQNVQNKGAAAGTNLALYQVMADLLLELFDLSELVKAKLGANADQSDAALKTLNAALTGGADALSGALEEISEKQRVAANANTESLLMANSQTTEAGANAVLDAQKSLASATTLPIEDPSVENLSNSVASATETISSTQDAVVAETLVVRQVETQVQSEAAELASTLSAVQGTTTSAVASLAGSIDGGLDAASNRTAFAIRLSANDLNQSLSIGIGAVASYLTEVGGELRRGISDLSSEINSSDFRLRALIDYSAELEKHSLLSTQALSAAADREVGNFSAAVQARLGDWNTRLHSLVGAFAGALMDTMAGKMNVSVVGPSEARLETLLRSLHEDALNASGLRSDFGLERDRLAEIVRDFEMHKTMQSGDIAELENSIYSLSAADPENLLLNETRDMRARVEGSLQSSAADVASLTAAVPTHIEAIVRNASEQISVVDGGRVRDFIAELSREEALRRGSLLNDQAKQAELRGALVNQILAELGLIRTQLLGRVAAASLGNSDQQLRANEALEALGGTLQVWAEGSGRSSTGMLQKLAGMSAITSSLATSLKTYQAQSQARLARDVAVTRAGVKSNMMQAMVGSQGETSTLGSRVLGILDNFDETHESAETLLAQRSSATAQMQVLLRALGEEGRSELKAIMERIRQGQMTAEEAVDLAGKMSMKNFISLGDVAELFMNLLIRQMAVVGGFVEEASETVDQYAESAMRGLTKKEAVLMKAAQGIGAVDIGVQGLSAGFEAETARINEVGRLTADTVSREVENSKGEVKAVEAMLEAAVKETSDEIMELKKNQTEEIKQMTLIINTQITAMINEFRSVHNMTAKLLF